jgi:hypothetical protein
MLRLLKLMEPPLEYDGSISVFKLRKQIRIRTDLVAADVKDMNIQSKKEITWKYSEEIWYFLS